MRTGGEATDTESSMDYLCSVAESEVDNVLDFYHVCFNHFSCLMLLFVSVFLSVAFSEGALLLIVFSNASLIFLLWIVLIMLLFFLTVVDCYRLWYSGSHICSSSYGTFPWKVGCNEPSTCSLSLVLSQSSCCSPVISLPLVGPCL